MTAVFGRLQGETLELSEGLNIIQAPNETGKSTWCAFLLSMLYGINSQKRERAGFIPDKTRYAPWSGKPMSGRLDCRFQGQALSLLRSTRRQTSPLREFQAVYTGTGEPFPGLTEQTCGETLLGVSREVFERSAFIRQAGLPISQDAELERRIAALITSGEEDVSYSEAAALLKKQLNRRRHNKTGQIPALETALREVEEQLEKLESLEARLTEAQAQAEHLSAQEVRLLQELEHWDRWEASEKSRILEEARRDMQSARTRADALRQSLEQERIPENDAIGRLRGAIVNLETTRKSVRRLQEERDEAERAHMEAEAAVNAHPFAGLTPEQAAALPLDLSPRPRRSLWIPLLSLLAGAGLGCAVWLFRQNLPLSIGCGCGLLGLGLLIAVLLLRKKRASWEAQSAVLREQRQRELADYDALCRALETARANDSAKSAAYDSLHATLTTNEEGILLAVRRFAPAVFDIPSADAALRGCAVRRKELLSANTAAREARLRLEVLEQQAPAEKVSGGIVSPPLRDREAVSRELERTRAALSDARSQADCLTGQCRALGDAAILRSAGEHQRRQLGELEGEYAALSLALEQLDLANAALQTRFSPALGRRTGEIFQELTGDRYQSVVLDRDLRLSAEPAGDTLYRSAGLLSAGAADQLYLAARLAICEMVLPEELAVPIILDDALANFDDERCAAALRWLRQAAEKRQILLFTCHSREGDFFAGDKPVSVQRLTNPA